MDKERQVVHIDLKDCSPEEVAFRLKKHTNIDIDDIPAKYGTSLLDAQKLIQERLKISIVYQAYDIQSIEEKAVTLTNGEVFTGPMAPRILKHASSVVCFVCTLADFNDLRDSTDDVMIDYFLDSWGTVYAECGQWWLEQHLSEILKGSGVRRTYSWNPGQYNFELLNQKPLFRMLQPDDIGCVLDKHMRMLPFKSTSGIIGIVDEALPVKEDLIPCAFCSLHETCPASKVRKTSSQS